MAADVLPDISPDSSPTNSLPEPSNRARLLRAVGLVLLLGFFYGSTIVVSRFSVGQYDPRTYISLRLLLAAACHVGVYAFSRQRRWSRDRGLWWRAGLLGVIGTALPMTAVVSSLQYLSSGVASLLLTLNPVIVVVLAQFFLRDEKLTWLKSAGVAVAFSGAGLLFLRGETGLSTFAETDWHGYAWVAVGVLAGGGAAVYARRFLRTGDAWDVASIRMVTAAAVLLPIVALTVGFDMSNVTAIGYAGLLYAALTGTFGGMWLSFYLIKQYGATVASQTTYVIPIISTVLGAVALGEQISGTMLAGMAIIFAGLTLLNWRGTMASTVDEQGETIWETPKEVRQRLRTQSGD